MKTVAMRRLIINADDFGFTAGVNRGIVEAHSRGVVTSSTLMANGPAFSDAVQLAPTVPRLSVGCHVVLVDGQPVLDPTIISSLVGQNEDRSANRDSGFGRFPDGISGFALRALTGRLNPREIEAEATAQIRKIQDAGIVVSHLDTHKHTHLFPRVLRPLLRAGAACGVRAVRNPFGPRRPLRSGQLLARPGIWTRYAEMRVLQGFAGRFRAAVEEEGFATPDGTLGVEVTGILDQTLFHAIATSIPEGTWEFVCHPGYNDADLGAAKTRLRESREIELHALTLPEARNTLSQAGIALISYRDLCL
ncbi:MAG: ChbG/HpnK family deacetylase [Candidatus Sulfotelmatobacter sp.]